MENTTPLIVLSTETATLNAGVTPDTTPATPALAPALAAARAKRRNRKPATPATTDATPADPTPIPTPTPADATPATETASPATPADATPARRTILKPATQHRIYHVKSTDGNLIVSDDSTYLSNGKPAYTPGEPIRHQYKSTNPDGTVNVQRHNREFTSAGVELPRPIFPVTTDRLTFVR